jgi:hypothetical protein
MQSRKLWLAFGLTAVLVLVVTAVAQPPDQKKLSSRGFVDQPPISVEDIVARIMRFDRNKDGKVSKDELPERMHHLIALGDTNKDGALDRDEIKKLATRLSPAQGGFGFGGGIRAGARPRPGDVKFQVRVGPGPVTGGFRRGFGPGPGADAIEGVVDDLKLPGKKKEQALAVVKAHQENVRKLLDQARADLLEKMKQVLSKEEFEDFKAALDRPRGVVGFAVGPPDIPKPTVVERKSERRGKD